MDTLSAFIMGEANRDRESMVFDWVKAATLIARRRPRKASAGLSGDWEYTGGIIYRSGAPVPKEDTYTFLASTWATPELELDGEILDCYTWHSQSGWDSDTYWPSEALAILSTR